MVLLNYLEKLNHGSILKKLINITVTHVTYEIR